jgi:hypothetical protein
MDLSKQFTFTDILAYFFPGAFAAIGLFLLLLLSPAQKTLASINLDITTGFIFLIFSYIIGVILSSFSSLAVKRIEKLMKHKDVHGSIPSDLFPNDIVGGFKDVMGISKDTPINWSNAHYRVCLMLVMDKMPSLAQRIDRQRNIALFRRNLVFPLIIWAINGIGWGIWNTINGPLSWGILLIIGSIVASGVCIRETVTRMHHGESVEVRETLSGFIAGYKLGIFTKTK